MLLKVLVCTMSVVEKMNGDELQIAKDDANVFENKSMVDIAVESNDAVETEKRARKMTEKGVSLSIENLQRQRKSKFTQVNKVKKRVNDLLSGKLTKGTVSDVQKYYKSFETLCKDAIETHNSLLEMPMSKPEYEKQQSWLVCTMKENNEFITDVKQWLSDAGVSYSDGGDDGMSITDTNINPDDSVSNATRKGSQCKTHSSSSSSRVSSTASARLKAKAERAALLQSVAALNKLHVLEAKEEELQRQKEKLRREKEQLQMETKLAAATAKLSVLELSEGSVEGMSEEEDPMNAYYKKRVRSCASNKCSTSKMPSQQQSANSQHDHLSVRPKERLSMQTQAQASRHCKPSSTRQQISSSDENVHIQAPPPVSTRVHTPSLTLHDVVQQQNNITAQLIKQQALVSLPPRRMLEFDGDPLQYGSFIKAFAQAIEKKTSDKQECLYYLEQYTRGRPRELVRSCHNMRADQGYDRARIC